MCLALVATLLSSAPAVAQPPEYDHVHVSVPDVDAAARSYVEHMGGIPVRPGQGSTLLMFRVSAGATPSAGSVIDHIDFSFPVLESRMQ